MPDLGAIFSATLKAECIDHRFATRDAARTAIFDSSRSGTIASVATQPWGISAQWYSSVIISVTKPLSTKLWPVQAA